MDGKGSTGRHQVKVCPLQCWLVSDIQKRYRHTEKHRAKVMKAAYLQFRMRLFLLESHHNMEGMLLVSQ